MRRSYESQAAEAQKRLDNPDYARKQDAEQAKYQRDELIKKNKELDSNALFSLLAGPFLFFFPSLAIGGVIWLFNNTLGNLVFFAMIFGIPTILFFQILSQKK